MLNNGAASGIVPGAVVGSVPSSDTNLVNHPVNIMASNAAGPNNDVAVLSGLLNISTSGVYSFGVDADEGEIVIDGQPIHLGDNSGRATNFQAGFTTGSVDLTAGLHQIAIRQQNGSNQSGIQVMYTGPDTLNAGTPGYGWQNIAPSNLYSATALTGSVGGNGYMNAAQINNTLSVVASAAATVDVGGSDFNSTFAGLSLAQAATLTVNNMEGGGYIGVTGNTSLAASAAVNPNTGMLYLIGGVTDNGNGLTKIGQGTLILGSSAATPGNGGAFTGPLAITNGYVQVAAANALTSGTTTVGSVAAGTGATVDLNGTQGVTGTILLNGSGPTNSDVANPTALYNSNPAQASLAAGSLVLIGTSINSKAPSIGGYGDIAIYGTIADGPTAGLPWTKTGPDTLILAGSNTFTGPLTVSMGVLALGGSNAFGSTSAGTVTINAGTTFDLAGQSITATAKTLVLNGAGLTGYAMTNTLGGLINSAGNTTSTYAGAITLGSAVNIGANTYNSTASAGNIVLSGLLSGNQTLTKVGANNLILAGSSSSTGAITVSGGTVTLENSFTQAPAAVIDVVSAGATLVLDNTPAAGGVVNNRVGGRAIESTGGTVLIRSGATGTSTTESLTSGGENFNVGGLANGMGIFTFDASAGGALMVSVSSTNTAMFSAQNQGTALIRGTSLGQYSPGTPGSATFTGSGTSLGTTANTGQVVGQTGASGANMLVYPWAVADTSVTGNGIGFATYGTNGVRPLNFSTTGGSDGVVNALTTNDDVELISGLTTTSNSGLYSLNSLTIAGSGTALVINPGSTVGLQSGGLLALNGTSTISGGGALSTTTNAQLFIHTPNPNSGGGTTQLNINVPILGTTGAVTKSDGGVAAFGVQQLYTGQTNVNGGTLLLAGGNQTLYTEVTTSLSPGNIYNVANTPSNNVSLMVNYGGTLDLNGNTQVINNLTNATNGMNTAELPNSGGVITNSNTNTTANLAVLVAGNNQYFGGSINGNLNLTVAGGWTYYLESANGYAGTTTKQGGNLTLQDLGALTNTSAIYLNGGALSWNDTGTQAGIQRVPVAATMHLNSGAFNYSARNGVQGSATIGNISLDSGASLVNVVANNGGATLAIGGGTGTSLVQTSPVATVNFQGSNSLGIGDAAHVFFAVPPALTSGLIGAWATVNQEDALVGQAQEPGFATYTTSAGLGNINANLVPLATGAVPAGVNALVNAGVTLPTGGVTLNTVSIINAGATISFTNATDQLVITTGGILTGYDNNGKAVGQSANFGQVTAGAGQQSLFIHSGANTLTVNSSIVDNGVAGGMNVVIDNMSQNGGGTVTLAGTNSYLGTTYINSTTNLNATGGVAIPGNLVVNSAVYNGDGYSYYVTLNQSSQIAPTANVTLNGGTILNLNSFNNTIANLTLANSGGEQAYVSATVATGTGALTVTGSVGVAGNNDVYLVPLLTGRLVLANTSNPTISVAPNANSPYQTGLQLDSALTLHAPATTPLTVTGGGVLAIGGQSQYANATSVAAGTTLAFGFAGAEIGNSQVNLAAGATLDARGASGTIGSLTGSGTLTNNAFNPQAAGTLVTGWDNTNTTFSGAILSPFAQYPLSLTKIGGGNFNLIGNNSGAGLNSPNSGTLTVSGGSVTLNSSSAVEGFSAYTLNAGGAVTLDNSQAVVNNRLGGSYELASPSVATATTTLRTMTFQGGNLTVIGGTSAVAEGLGTVNLGTAGNGGGSVLTLAATNTSGVNLVINTLAAASGYGTLLVRGDGLGSPAGAGVATVSVANSASVAYPAIYAQGGGTDGTTSMPIRPDIIVDTSSTGSGAGFAVIGTAGSDAGLLRPLAAAEMVNSVAALSATTNTVNVGLSTAQTITGGVGLNSLTLSGSGSIGGGLFPASGLTVNSGGILATSGTTSIAATALASGPLPMEIHVAGASTVLNLNSPIVNPYSGLVKADAGTLVLGAPQYYAGAAGTQVNGGLLQLAGGNNTIMVQPGAATPSLLALGVNGGTLDLDGNSQAVGNLSSVNVLPGTGGTITNSSTAAVAFIVNPAANGTFAGTIGAPSGSGAGALAFYKQGANTLLLTGTSNYTGPTNVEGGTLALRDGGMLTGGGPINLNYATLLVDNTGLAPVAARTGSSPINLNGGQITVNGRMGNDYVTFGALSVAQGASTINANLFNGNQQTGLVSTTFASLAASGSATVNFAAPNVGTLGNGGDTAYVYFTQAPTLTSNIIGGWAVVNGAAFAAYSPTLGVGALGSAGFTAYSNTNNLAGGVATDNVNVTQSATGVTNRTVNSLTINNPGAFTGVIMNTGTDALTLGSGGLLINDSTHGSSIYGGMLTAGSAANTAATFYLYDNTNTVANNIYSPIVNNGSGAVSLVKAGPGTTTLTPETLLVANTWASGATTIIVPNSAGLFVGEGVASGQGIQPGTTITAISGGSLTLSLATTASQSGPWQFFTAPSASSVLNNTGTLTTTGTFTPFIGMAVGGAGIPAGSNVTAISGSSGAWTLTLNNAATVSATNSLTFGAPSNSYSGTTVVNQGTLNLSGQVGSVVVPGNLAVNGGTVAMNANAGQIAPASNVTLGGGGSLTLTGSNVLNSVSFTGIGGTNQTALNISGGLLTLSASNAVTAQNDNTAMTPQIGAPSGSGSLAFASTTPTINTSGLSANNLVIAAPIVSSGGPLTIAGTGSVVLSGASTFANGVNLNQGTIILAAGSTTTSGTVSSGPLGTGTFTAANGTTLEGAAGPQAIGNPVVTNGNLIFGGATSTNNLGLSGPVTLGGATPTLTVAEPPGQRNHRRGLERHGRPGDRRQRHGDAGQHGQ